jgi:hypothetical protein
MDGPFPPVPTTTDPVPFFRRCGWEPAAGAASLNQTVTTSQIDNMGYALFTFDFNSTGGNVDLTFTPNDYSPEPNFMLDNVSVTAVTVTPEPSYFLVMALGLFGLVLYSIRLRRERR